MKRDTKFWMLLVLLCLAHLIAQADWIVPYTSPQAGIDSLERFMVIRDYKDSTFLGEVLLSLGDVNGDSYNDLLTGRRKLTAYADDSGFVFMGGIPSDSVIDLIVTGFESSLTNIGDINGDGLSDFAMTPIPETGINFYFGGQLFDDVQDFVISNVYSPITRAGQFLGDGVPYYPVGALNGGFVRLYRIDSLRDTIPEFIIPDTSRDFGNNLAVMDFNGDGFDDLLVSAYRNRSDPFVKGYFGGPLWDTIADFQLTSSYANFGQLLVPLGDFNNDGVDDIYIGGPSEDPYGVHFGSNNPSSTYDILTDASLSDATYEGASSAAAVGDINKDGYPDLLLGSVSLAEECFLFLGGPNADSVVDLYINQIDHIPGSQRLFGSHIAGIGDFNGDGIDDFAIYSRTQTGCCWFAEVNLFSGWDGMSTDVESANDPHLPESFALRQNYPNPFNPETTIQFTISKVSNVELSVYNILGQRVCDIVAKRHHPGAYQYNWNGTDERGNRVASGVYLCILKVDGVSLTKTMMLVK